MAEWAELTPTLINRWISLRKLLTSGLDQQVVQCSSLASVSPVVGRSLDTVVLGTSAQANPTGAWKYIKWILLKSVEVLKHWLNFGSFYAIGWHFLTTRIQIDFLITQFVNEIWQIAIPTMLHNNWCRGWYTQNLNWHIVNSCIFRQTHEKTTKEDDHFVK